MSSQPAALLTVALFLAADLGAAPLQAGPTWPAYFPTAVGARWVYQGSGGEMTSVVTGVEEQDGAKLVTTALPMEDGERFPIQKVSVSDRGLFLVWTPGGDCTPPLCLLRPAEKWENRSIVASLPVRELVEAFAPEEVATPAGTFLAVRVESNATCGFGGGWTRTTTWYAPGVGLVKQMTGGEVSMILKSFTPGGTKAVANGKPPPLVLRSPRHRITLDSEADPVAYSPDGVTLATAGRDGSIRLREVKTGKERATLKGQGERVRSLAYSPDGKALASAVGLWGPAQFKPVAGVVEVWDLASGKVAATLGGHEGVVSVLAYSPDGRTLAAAGESAIKLWNVRTGKERATLKGPSLSVLAVAFSPDGKTLASSGYHGSIRLWNVETGKEESALKGHSLAVLSVAYSPDGKTLASGSEDQTIKLWNVETGQERATLKGHTHLVRCVAYSPDGKTLASGSEYGGVKLWNAKSGKDLVTLKGHTNRVCSVAFSPDGKTVVSASLDRTINLWDASSAK